MTVDVKTVFHNHGRYVWRLLVAFVLLSMSLYMVRQIYVTGGLDLRNRARTHFSLPYSSRTRKIHENVEIWDKPWPVKNETWAKLRTTQGKIDIMIYPSELDKIVSYSLLLNGSWEPGEILGVERLFKCDKDLGLIDIGANIGLYVLLGAKHKRQVVAVEPSMGNLGRLYASVQKNNFQQYVTLVHNAISNKYSTMELTANPWNRGNTVIKDSKNPDFHVPGEFEVEDRLHVGVVKTILMDDLVPLVKFERGILKIDIEGAERLAFQFSRDFLSLLDIPYIFMEWLWIKQDPEQAKTLYTLFTENGYQPFKNAHLNIRLRDNYLDWPTDVFWVNFEKSGSCMPDLMKWQMEGLVVPEPKGGNTDGYLPGEVVDRIKASQDKVDDQADTR